MSAGRRSFLGTGAWRGAVLLPWLLAALACAGGTPPEPEPKQDPAAAIERYLGAGRRWEGSGMPDAATLYFERAVAAAERLPQPDVRLAEARFELGDALRRQARLDEAKQALEQALADLEPLRREHPELQARILDALGYVQMASGDPETASSTLARALQIRVEVLDARDVGTAETLVNLAEAHHRIGEPQKAATLLVEAAAIYSGLGPEYLMRIATIHNNLGTIYRDLGDYQQAEKLHLEAIRLARRVQEKDNPNIAIFQRSLANLYMRTGHERHALGLYKESLETLERTLGPDHYETRATRSLLEEYFPDAVPGS